MSQPNAHVSSGYGGDPAVHGLPPYALVLGMLFNPFPVTPDETHYFFTPTLEAIFEEVSHFIEMRKGFLLLTGDVGLGKTTLLRRLLASFDKSRYNTALVLTSFLNQSELLETIARDFGLKLPHGARRIDHLAILNDFLLTESDKGKINVLFLDDAQALDEGALDVVRQLSNLETAQSKLIQVVLCGQPELLETLNQHSLRQVKSRIALHRKLQALDPAQTKAYILHRLAIAGAVDCIQFSTDGLQMLYECTGGFPRRLHHVMDRCLYALVACSGKQIDQAVVRIACQDLGWQVPKTSVILSGVTTRPRRFRRTALMWAGLAGVSMAALGGFFVGENRRPTAQPVSAPALTFFAAPTIDLIAAPTDWTTARTAFDGLADLRWPTASTIPVLTQQLQKNLLPSSWQLVAATGVWASPCSERPMLALRDGAGAFWYLSFVELGWPIAPVALRYRSETIRRLQQHLSAQGSLGFVEADGIMGSRTVSALARFQLAQGLEGTGQFNPPTAYRLSCGLAHSASSVKG